MHFFEKSNSTVIHYYSDFILKIYHFLQSGTASRCHLLHLIQNVHNQLKKYIPDTDELVQSKKKEVILKSSLVTCAITSEKINKAAANSKNYIFMVFHYHKR